MQLLAQPRSRAAALSTACKPVRPSPTSGSSSVQSHKALIGSRARMTPDLALNFPGLGDGRQVARRHHHGPVGRRSFRQAQISLPPSAPSQRPGDHGPSQQRTACAPLLPFPARSHKVKSPGVYLVPLSAVTDTFPCGILNRLGEPESPPCRRRSRLIGEWVTAEPWELRGALAGSLKTRSEVEPLRRDIEALEARVVVFQSTGDSGVPSLGVQDQLLT